jgi:hypothetical protein
MANTANGLPYPIGTDLVRDGDNAIQNLADALQRRGHGLRVVSTYVACDPVSSGYTWFRVPLGGTNFISAPFCMVQCQTTGSGLSYLFNHDLVLTTGEIGGYMRDVTPSGCPLTGNGFSTIAHCWLIGPI